MTKTLQVSKFTTEIQTRFSHTMLFFLLMVKKTFETLIHVSHNFGKISGFKFNKQNKGTAERVPAPAAGCLFCHKIR